MGLAERLAPCLMKLHDIITRVQAKCDDIEGTYITPEYVMGFVAEAYEWLYGKLRLTDYSFDERIVVLPAVPAGSPDLVTYQQSGGMLEELVQPTMIRWKLPGASPTLWRRANGPMDLPRDMPVEGYPYLDSWAWIRYIVELSTFSTDLDLEITGSFLFDPLTDPDSPIEISKAANRVLSCKIASEVGKGRGNDKWVTAYSADADEALDDLTIQMVKADQAIPHRLARMSRKRLGTSNNVNSGQ